MVMKERFKSFRMLFFRFFIAIIVTELARKNRKIVFFSVKMVNILEIRPFLTMKGLTHGPKILARKSSITGLDSP